MRVQDFPAPGTKVSASEFIITGGGCAANAAVAIARLGGRAVFAGPLGGTGDQVSNRIVSDLAAVGIDVSGALRVDGATASVSLILLDAEGEKTIATRRGARLGDARPADAGKLVADVDAVLVDNRFPEFVTRCAAPRRREGFRSSSISIWRASRTTRCFSSAPMWWRRRKPCTAPPA